MIERLVANEKVAGSIPVSRSIMSITQSIILGFVQGVTEFLPVSSSGHLVIAQNIFNLHPPLLFDVFLHLGTLFAVLFFMRKKIIMLMKNMRTNKTLLASLAVATIVTGIAGLSLHDKVEQAFNSLNTVGFFLVLTGVLLLITKVGSFSKLGFPLRPIIVGIAQSFALFPGLSRSGTTISTGLILGLTPSDAFEFSFLLYIPAAIGALLLECFKTKPTDIQNMLVPGIVGIVAAFAVGVVSLTVLKKVLVSNKLWYFSIYCFALGILLILI